MNKNKCRKLFLFLFGFTFLFLFENISNAAPAPPVPGNSELLTKVFRNPNGKGPELLTDKVLQITPAINSQHGSIWSKEKLDLNKDFEISAYLYLGDSFERAADGITFTLQNDPRMDTLSETSVLGDAGMGLGAYSNKSRGQYVRNALSVEFDTYYNAGHSNRMDREVGENGKRGHIAVVTPKSNNNNYTGEHSAITLSPEYLSNGTWRKVTFIWESSSHTLHYNLEGIGSNSYIIPNVMTQFGSNEVYWGFTASTGAYNAQNLIAITELPQKLSSEATIKNLTNQTGPDIKVEAIKGDQLELEAEVKASGFVDSSTYEHSNMEVVIPDGITPNLENIKINDKYISEDKILFENGVLKILDVTLSDSGTTLFSIEAKVTSDKGEVILESDFTLTNLENKVLTQSNKISIEIPKIKIGEVVLKYIDTDNNIIKDEEKVTGIVGDKFEVEPAFIDGYQLSEIIGNTQGFYEESTQTVIFKYRTAQFNLKQMVQKKDGSEANIASIEETLIYTVELESLFKEEAEGVFYKEVSIKNNLPEYLTDISEIELKTRDNQLIGNAAYDEEHHCVIGKILAGDKLIRTEDITLSFQAKIDPNTVEKTIIKMNAEASALYSNGLDSGLVKSNEVSTQVEGGVYLLSVPKSINFGTITYDATVKTVDDGVYDQSLIVSDTRLKKSKWTLGAKLISQMTLIDKPNIKLVDALQYVNEGKSLILSENLQPIYQAAESSDETAQAINISDTWGTTKDSDGIKLVVDPSKSKILSGEYEGEIEWQLMEGQP